MTSADEIAAHYSSGSLLEAIRNGLERAGTDLGQVTIEDLAPVDEFHIGGRPATRHLCEQLGLDADDRVLDVGCGIGGTARFLAATYGCSVTGIDLTPEYINVARELSAWTATADRTDFFVASAVGNDIEASSFDVAMHVHVGMNIADKGALFESVHRLLRRGGRFAVYDIMRINDGPVSFPVPWATDASHSHLADLATYRSAALAAGFEVDAELDRGSFARDVFAQLASNAGASPPPIGLHVIMGADAPTKIANMVAAVSAGTIAPTELIVRKPA